MLSGVVQGFRMMVCRAWVRVRFVRVVRKRVDRLFAGVVLAW